jgi:hypothetical protein
LIIDEKEPYMIFEAYRQNNSKYWGEGETKAFILDFISALEFREKKKITEKKNFSKEEIQEFDDMIKVNF